MNRRLDFDSKIKDLVDYTGKEVKLTNYSGDVVIKSWKFINYKSSVSEYENGDFWVHFHTITFVNCIFKDIHFAGAVPLHGCVFRRCKFENCIFADHIRWNKFDNCSFDVCIFAGYFHGTTIKKNCTYNNVLFEYYGEDSYFGGYKSNNCYNFINSVILNNTKSRYDILSYIYPKEIFEVLTYKIGQKFLFLNGDHYVEDVVNNVVISLEHYKPDIRVVGENYRYHMQIEKCKNIIWLRKQKLEKISNS